MSATDDARSGPHECPFDEDYYAWVAGETAYLRGYRVDATCGDCGSQLDVRFGEHTFLFTCPECVVQSDDAVTESSRATALGWRVSMTNSTDLSQWSVYLAGEQVEIEQVPHGIEVRGSLTDDGDEYTMNVALPEKGQEYDVEANGGESGGA
ncbi:hypothetical protein [Halorubrum ezzemoulense]|uniref:Uncharacterized protein n=1 Tax=Halorubrum ezzemoulense TaxID=337243 RepID=A0A256J5T8_HALEZ|nr:hypothetical protein [Halorubrum ezzemoulense]OYR64180.1 hypothetical protein DJ80_06005 [Halorubrum ezzemoulense]